MQKNPYETPKSNVEVGFHGKYRSYDEVPLYRRQWFFWLTYFTISPVALGILLFGDVYYVKKGAVVGFGIANRIVAGIIAALFLVNILGKLIE